MAYAPREQWHLAGRLLIESGLHVGGLDPDPGVDLSLAKDGQGRLVVPGTGLAGALRAWTEERLGPSGTVALWGEVRSGAGGASRVFVEDGLVYLPEGTTPDIRDGVGIDRHTGAAAPGIKYTRAVLPRGTQIDFALTVEGGPPGAQAPGGAEWLGSLVADLTGHGLILGAGRTGGLGRVRLQSPPDGPEAQVWYSDRRNRAGILAALRHGGTPVALDQLGLLPPGAASAGGSLRVAVTWMPELPLLVGSGHAGTGVDVLPRTAPAGAGHLAFLLPGRSVKGVLRAHAERIVRTVLGLDVEPAPRPDDFLGQLDPGPARAQLAPTRMPRGSGRVPGIVADLFGSRDRRGALTVRDCYSVDRLPADVWRRVEGATDLREAARLLLRCGLSASVPAMHVAVDRWTGAAADHRLFSAVELHGVRWEPLQLEMDLSWLGQAPGAPEAHLALLLLVLQDFGEGWLSVGGGGNRGHGQIRASEVLVSGHGIRALQDPMRWMPADGLPGAVHGALGPAWSGWLESQGGQGGQAG